ncbi:hypothetical protein R3P82_06715 [Dietzia maris]|uniref:Acyl-CoA dehydrogenase n=1 Tax=Dietzia maris TaxID=37915 RepID=A0AAE4QV49_9ACTN|nr:hypothetical protein [Dietzia maris]MDV6298804.1 hypothetical protein [Dietzia maris]
MTGTGNLRRVRAKGAIAAIGLGTAVIAATTLAAPSETLASFADNVFAGGQFLTGRFGLQTSLTAEGPFSDGPTNLPGSTNPGTVAFSTPIALTPGATSYAPVYLRTTSNTTSSARVGISTPAKGTSNTALWGTPPSSPGLITYAARAVPTMISSTCNAAVWTGSQGDQLYPPNSPFYASTASTFILDAAAETTYMVCFRFTLASNVTSAPAGTNGASVYPVWTFNGISPTP